MEHSRLIGYPNPRMPFAKLDLNISHNHPLDLEGYKEKYFNALV